MNGHIVILGTAFPYRGGGISTFNERLAKAFMDEGYEVTIYNFTLQYPSFLFPGKSQYAEKDATPPDLNILRKVNSINPFNWLRIGKELRKLKPDIIVARFWIPLMGPALGTILRRAKKNRHTSAIAITDNVIPHEKRPGDIPFTKYFLRSCDAFVTMSEKVMQDLKKFEPAKPAVNVEHPLYDNFGPAITKIEARHNLGLNPDDNIILFFGFIRKYKGLDLLLNAMQINKDRPYKLLIAGEFYDDENIYLRQIEELNIREKIILRTQFIPDHLVKEYFCAADVVIQPYRQATQSGVT
ncbi:MAG: glycosyltransferase, partial [Gemmatimonadaceae bacterium]|nr:glycosyltransferase [Chitinophagaceae bacterium]